MKKPRYSIIPAGAVTDRRLEGRDLQVLCLIGSYTDKLGWWSGTQTKISGLLSCGRATVQRSLSRLVEAEWLEIRRASVSFGGRPYAAYAYRVRMDRDDPDCEPSASDIEAQVRDDDAHGRAPQNDDCGTMPTGGHGAQGAQSESKNGQGVPTHTRAQDSRPSKDQVDEDDDSARARVALVSPEAMAIADELMVICGVDPQHPLPGWCGAAMRVQAFLSEGYQREHLVAGTRECMARKKTPGPPDRVTYFDKPWTNARLQAEAPLPKPDQPQAQNARRYEGRERTADVIRRLDEYSRSEPDGEATGGRTDGPSIARIPLPKLG